MPWSTTRPRARYYDAAHTKTRARHMAALQAAATGRCAEIECIAPSRLITPDMDLHLCHHRATGAVLGLGHKRCNLHEAAVYARSRQNTTRRTW